MSEVRQVVVCFVGDHGAGELFSHHRQVVIMEGFHSVDHCGDCAHGLRLDGGGLVAEGRSKMARLGGSLDSSKSE